jgi:hypothetical protein
VTPFFKPAICSISSANAGAEYFYNMFVQVNNCLCPAQTMRHRPIKKKLMQIKYYELNQTKSGTHGHMSVSKPYQGQVPVAHTCNHSYLGDWDQEDHILNPAQTNSSQNPILQNNQNKMGWRCGSSSRVSAFKCEALNLNPSPIKRKLSEKLGPWVYWTHHTQRKMQSPHPNHKKGGATNTKIWQHPQTCH